MMFWATASLRCADVVDSINDESKIVECNPKLNSEIGNAITLINVKTKEVVFFTGSPNVSGDYLNPKRLGS